MKKWYNWNENIIKSFDFIKNLLIIYLVGSLIAWNLNIGEWWVIGRIIFIIFVFINIKLSYED